MNGISGAEDGPALRRRLADGDPAAFEEVYDRYGGRLYRTAARYLGCATEAEDVVQELFVALVRSRDQLSHVEHLVSYLFVSLRRLVVRVSQQRRRRARAIAQRADTIATAAAAPMLDLRESLEMALKKLPDDQRDVVILKIDSELTFADIAQVLGISPNTAASRYRYALEKLRTVLASEEVRREPRN